MRRRQYLAASTLAVAGLAGCSGVLGDGGGAGDGPEATVEAFLEAIDEGDRERANELIHSDSPQGEIEEGDLDESDDFELTVDETELESDDDDTAAVSVEYAVEPTASDDSQSVETTYELRTEDGNWRIWDEASSDDDSGDSGGAQAPTVSWEFRDLPEEDAVRFTHSSGDTIDRPGGIAVRGGDGTEYGTLAEIIGGERITAGDSGTVDVPGDSSGRLQLVWTGPDGDDSQIIAEHEYDVS